MTVTIDQQIACVRREIALRKNVYPKWVAARRMKQETATAEIEALQGAHDTLMLVKEGRLIPVLSGTIPQPPGQAEAPAASKPADGQLL